MVDVMPTVLALAGAHGSEDHPFDGKDIWQTLAKGASSTHEDILINVEAFRGAIRKGNWKLVKIALFRERRSCSICQRIHARRTTSLISFPRLPPI